MARTRTTKKLAQRIDPEYFRRPQSMRRLRLALSIAVSAAALVWVFGLGVAGKQHIYQAGTLSRAHAVLSDQCGACHVAATSSFRKAPADQACLACHDGPIHHANQLSTPGCVPCHSEHRGPIRLAATSDSNCTKCHADLRIRGGSTMFAPSISSFADDHPEFAVLRARRRDPGTIKFNHAAHLRPDLRGPKSAVQLDCGDCHGPSAARADWRFGDAHSRSMPAPSAADRSLPLAGRELMAPPKYAQTCSACHLLQFDKRFVEGVPHDTPEIVHAFLVKKFQEFIAVHPAELRVVRDPDRNLTGKPIVPAVRILAASQWIAEHASEAEALLWRKTCKECHSLSFAAGAALPRIEPANITTRWFRNARFNHDAHRGFSCTSCHAGASTSQETADVLLPGIATCRSCHAPGENHAESRCSECHTYHDWSKRKEVRPSFVLPPLRSALAPRAEPHAN
jgi:hypothetical protein